LLPSSVLGHVRIVEGLRATRKPRNAATFLPKFGCAASRELARFKDRLHVVATSILSRGGWLSVSTIRSRQYGMVAHPSGARGSLGVRTYGRLDLSLQDRRSSSDGGPDFLDGRTRLRRAAARPAQQPAIDGRSQRSKALVWRKSTAPASPKGRNYRGMCSSSPVLEDITSHYVVAMSILRQIVFVSLKAGGWIAVIASVLIMAGAAFGVVQ
jgi:hypothetical protein